MKEIKYDEQFLKEYKKFIGKDARLRSEFRAALRLFRIDKNTEILRDHTLEGKLQGLSSFSVNYSIRVVYLEKEDSYKFLRIGPHEIVYK